MPVLSHTVMYNVFIFCIFRLFFFCELHFIEYPLCPTRISDETFILLQYKKKENNKTEKVKQNNYELHQIVKPLLKQDCYIQSPKGTKCKLCNT